MVQYLREIKKLRNGKLLVQTNQTIFFIPGLFLFILGFLALVAPGLLIVLMAGFFVFCGIMLTYVAWKFIVIKKKFEAMLRHVEGKVTIHTVGVQNPFPPEEEPEGKKIIFH